MRVLRGAIVAGGIVAILVALAPAADAGSLYRGPGPRPGPDILYSNAPVAPQLQNTGPWKAPPILVSGAEAYQRGEFLYQDSLLDDSGAAGTPDPNDPFNPAANLFSPRHGTLTYPTDPVFANNAADLVELRVKPLSSTTAFRVTLSTLKDPERTAFTIALGNSPDLKTWPYRAGVAAPPEEF